VKKKKKKTSRIVAAGVQVLVSGCDYRYCLWLPAGVVAAIGKKKKKNPAV
jgi:hypothetical protein